MAAVESVMIWLSEFCNLRSDDGTWQSQILTQLDAPSIVHVTAMLKGMSEMSKFDGKPVIEGIPATTHSCAEVLPRIHLPSLIGISAKASFAAATGITVLSAV